MDVGVLSPLLRRHCAGQNQERLQIDPLWQDHGLVYNGRPSVQELRSPIVKVEWTCRLIADGLDRWGTQAGMLAAYYGAVDGEGGDGGDGWQ